MLRENYHKVGNFFKIGNKLIGTDEDGRSIPIDLETEDFIFGYVYINPATNGYLCELYNGTKNTTFRCSFLRTETLFKKIRENFLR